ARGAARASGAPPPPPRARTSRAGAAGHNDRGAGPLVAGQFSRSGYVGISPAAGSGRSAKPDRSYGALQHEALQGVVDRRTPVWRSDFRWCALRHPRPDYGSGASRLPVAGLFSRSPIHGNPCPPEIPRPAFPARGVLSLAAWARDGALYCALRRRPQGQGALVYAQTTLDFNAASDPRELSRTPLVWSGRKVKGVLPRLFKLSWENPFPDVEVASLDFETTMAESAPWVIAITAEP